MGYVLVSGLALGAMYALTALVYNTMYSTSKVLNFGAGQFAMVGGIVCAWAMLSLGRPTWEALILVIAAGAIFGWLTELIAVRRVIEDPENHLWVLTTIALSTMTAQGMEMLWGSEPQPFPRLIAQQAGTLLDQKYWLPVGFAVLAAILLELFYRRTMMGKTFVAVAEDEPAARARGISATRVRTLSYVLAGIVGSLSGLAAGQLTFADAHLGLTLTLGGFLALAVGGIGSSVGALIGGLIAGLLASFTSEYFGGEYQRTVALGVLALVLVVIPQGLFGRSKARPV